MNVGCVPDSFGQAGNMPQIYRHLGIEDFFFGVVSVMIWSNIQIIIGEVMMEVKSLQRKFHLVIILVEIFLKMTKDSEEFWQKNVLKSR